MTEATGLPEEPPRIEGVGGVLFVTASAYDALRAAYEKLQEQLTYEIQQRPKWAQGYSSDSIAAQVTQTALDQLWSLLGVDNQTDAVQRLTELRAAYEKAISEGREHLADFHKAERLWKEYAIKAERERTTREGLENALRIVEARERAAREALQQFAECDLNDNNCASLEVATARIRSIARAALRAGERAHD